MPFVLEDEHLLHEVNGVVYTVFEGTLFSTTLPSGSSVLPEMRKIAQPYFITTAVHFDTIRGRPAAIINTGMCVTALFLDNLESRILLQAEGDGAQQMLFARTLCDGGLLAVQTRVALDVYPLGKNLVCAAPLSMQWPVRLSVTSVHDDLLYGIINGDCIRLNARTGHLRRFHYDDGKWTGVATNRLFGAYGVVFMFGHNALVHIDSMRSYYLLGNVSRFSLSRCGRRVSYGGPNDLAHVVTLDLGMPCPKNSPSPPRLT